MEGAGLRLPNAQHAARPWRIHEITSDFRVEDLWALPEVGGPNEFAQLVRLIASLDPSQSSSCAVRLLFSLRWRLGEVFGWDNPDAGLDVRVPTLRDRLPPDLREGPTGPESSLPFRSLYLTENEWAAETANQTVHGVLHIGGVPDGSSGYRVRMAVLVKPNGLLGSTYMAAIKPFRYLVVYPAIRREIDRQWRVELMEA
jgi:hypothetical protein